MIIPNMEDWRKNHNNKNNKNLKMRKRNHRIHNLQSLQFHVHPIFNSIKVDHVINPWALQMLRQESSMGVGQR
jgi:hypothetical protein